MRFYAFCHFYALFCTKHATQKYLLYIIVLKWLEFKIIVICYFFYVLCCDFRGFYVFLPLLCIKLLILGLFCTKLCTQHDLVYIVVLKWLEYKIIVICNKLRIKLRFYAFLSVFDTFAHKVA